jgi:GAF domain-containing protein
LSYRTHRRRRIVFFLTVPHKVRRANAFETPSYVPEPEKAMKTFFIWNVSAGAGTAFSDNRDVSRVKELEAQLERANQQLHVFQQISRFMARELALPDILQGINKLIVDYMRCDSCLIYLIDAEELVLCSSNKSPGALGKVRLRMSEGLTGWVARERRLLCIPREAYLDRRFKKFAALPEDSYEAFLSAPVVARGRVVGVINVQHRGPHPHTGDEMELLSTVAEQIGTLLLLARVEPSALDAANHAELLFPATAR